MAERSRPGFRPRLWPTLFTLPLLLALIGLGTWQLERRAWKEALIADLQARTGAAPIALPAEIADPAALEYRPVRVTGRYLHDRELYLGARTYEGHAGLHVVTPLRLDDGRTVLVDRGWVPPAGKAPETRRDGQVEGPVTLEGLVRPGGWRGSSWFRPANDPTGNLWLWMDLPAMAAAARLDDPVTEVYLEARAGQHPGRLPIGGQTRVDPPNQHLSYAITWYALAVALVIIYLLFHRPLRRRPPAPRSPGAPARR